MKHILILIFLILGMCNLLIAQLSNRYTVYNASNTTRSFTQETWALDLEDTWVQAPLLVEDLNRDEIHEIAIQGFQEGFVYLVNNDGTYVKGWPQFIGEGNAAPISGNLDDDDDLEIIFTTYRNGIHAFNYDGTYVDGWPVNLYLQNSIKESKKLRFWESPTLYDINDDGKLELIISGFPSSSGNERFSSEVIILNNSGQIIQLAYPLTMTNPGTASVAIGDINNDNKPEIVAVDIPGNIYVWKSTGELLENWPSNAFADSLSRYVSPVLGDINNDGYKEIIISKSWFDVGWITVFDYQGNVLDNWPQQTSSIWEPASLSDMDNDGNIDIILNTDYPRNMYVFNYLAQEIPRFSKDIGSNHSPLITDLDGDGKLDIVAIANLKNSIDFGMFAWDNSGEIVPSFPLKSKTRGGTPVLGDFDIDGLMEIVFVAWNGDYDPATLYFWNLSFPFDKELTTWPTFRHDNWRTGCYTTETVITDVKEDNVDIIKKFYISSYPNPFNINTIIEVSILEKNDYTIKIYDVLGREVFTIYDGILNLGKYSFTFSGAELSSGVYLLRVNSKNYIESKKLILLK
jgi:Secretion system C-terminal sorting domain/FG-GAP-like repeat